MILPSLYTYLRSTSICNDIYPEFLPQTHGLPALVLELDGDNDNQLLDGSQSSLHEALVTVNVYDPSILSANTLAAAVKTALIGYVGPLGSVTAQCIYKESETSAPETDTGLRGVSLQFSVSYYN